MSRLLRWIEFPAFAIVATLMVSDVFAHPGNTRPNGYHHVKKTSASHSHRPRSNRSNYRRSRKPVFNPSPRRSFSPRYSIPRRNSSPSSYAPSPGAKKVLPPFRPKPTTVKYIKAYLSQMGYYEGTIDGVYDDVLLAGIERFQKENKLLVDGLPTAALLEKIKKVSGG